MNNSTGSNKNEPYAGTQSVLRAITLLEILSDEKVAWSLPELIQATSLNRTTIFRLLTALESFDLVIRDPQSDKYRLGSGLIALAGRALRANPLRTVSRPELESLSTITGEMATLEILRGHDVLVIDEVSVDRVISGTQAIGTSWPAYATSTGHALMAHLPEEALGLLLEVPLTPITPQTISKKETLLEQLSLVHQHGYAISEEMLELGFTDIGAPILNVDSYPVAAISIGGPTARLTGALLQEIGLLLRASAERISFQLGHRPAS